MKNLLVVVDYQKDFVDGSLGFEKAPSLEDKIAGKIKKYRENKDEVVFTLDTHGENYMKTQEGRKLPISHCIKGTDGWKLYGKIQTLCDETTRCFEKPCFGSMDLAEYIRKNKYDKIEFIGLVSNICVISNAVLAKAALPEAEIIVDASCTASADESINEKALDVMEGLQISVVNRDK